ncbi:MAG: ankyrin repeat domain-containing protein [Cognatishimia sp.]|uniref:ankyrin repeat domain-containing protein n=1 Tax=Cognatishimia sp. TaxID=2211648 RepID=UPI003B8DD05C
MSQSQTSLQLDRFRRAAKRLAQDHALRLPSALTRLQVHPPRSGLKDLRHADYLHVIAQENNFASWPALKLAAETIGLDRAALQQRLKIALAHGQNSVVDHLLNEHPDLPDGLLGAQIALYNITAVKAALWSDPKAATRQLGPRTPMAHLCFSKWHQRHPELMDDMIAIAELLVAHGADVNDSTPAVPNNDHRLSVLYGALCHADNMRLAKWLLEQGADPNDGESLYHATELGHHDGLDMLLAYGADPCGTNALLRAMDFDDHDAVRKLVAAGGDVNEFVSDEIGGEMPWVLPALHQAARRMCSAEMIDVLMEAGADPSLTYDGTTAYAYARIFGNSVLANAIEKHRSAESGSRGDLPTLTPEESLLALAAEGADTSGRYIDPDRLPATYRDMLCTILALPGTLPHVKRLVSLGLEYDRPDRQGLTPVQLAGWEGLPEVLSYFMDLKPDLGHINGYGGTLLSTIIHGSENNPNRDQRDYLACLKVVLTEGVAIPRGAIDMAGDERVSAFLSDWAQAYPGQVVDDKIV